jgi:hypothetical protein
MDRRSISQEMYAEEQPRGGACVRAVGIAFVVFSADQGQIRHCASSIRALPRK